MYKKKTKVSPLNRYITIVPHFEEKGDSKSSGVLLPEDFKADVSRHIAATVVSVAPDCGQIKKCFNTSPEDKTIVVDRSMIEEVHLGGKTHYMILENHVLGLLKHFAGN